jgi:acyl-CoA hydrolase
MDRLRPKSPADSAVETRYVLMPQNANHMGTAFGGAIMSWIDMIAGMAATRHCGTLTVTAGIDSISFITPIYVGEQVIIKSRVNYVGNTSLEVGVQVTKENPRTGEVSKATSAYLTFVALDENKKPVKVPELVLLTDDDRRRNENAKLRVKSRKELLLKMRKR